MTKRKKKRSERAKAITIMLLIVFAFIYLVAGAIGSIGAESTPYFIVFPIALIILYLIARYVANLIDDL